VALDSDLTLQARRLALGAELTRRAARSAGERIDRDADAAALIAIARELTAIAAPVERVREVGGGWRLVLASTVLDARAAPEATVFTTLIAGRPPLVTAAPAGAAIPAGWSALPPG
jgi:hypothetical protein